MSRQFSLTVLCVFFFKQKTAYEMRISDWSSDVCSSDLGRAIATEFVALVEQLLRPEPTQGARQPRMRPRAIGGAEAVFAVARRILHPAGAQHALADEILPALAGDLLDELPRDRIEDIVIGIGRAETRLGLEISDALDRLPAQIGRAHV